MSDGVAFIYSSQGLRRPGVGVELLAGRPAFSEWLAACEPVIARELGWSLLEELERPAHEQRLHADEGMLQPALTALQIALTGVLAEEGVLPGAVAGLSMGEAAAAHAAGALTLEDAIEVVCAQAVLTRRPLRPGAMGFVVLDADRTRRLLERLGEDLHVAVEFAPELTVVAGESEAVARGLEQLQAEGIRCGIVSVGAAYHSPEVDPLEAEFMARLAGLDPRPGSTPVYSTVVGDRIDGARLTAEHFWRIMRRPAWLVRMIEKLIGDGFRTFVEIGPGSVLRDSILSDGANARDPGHRRRPTAGGSPRGDRAR